MLLIGTTGFQFSWSFAHVQLWTLHLGLGMKFVHTLPHCVCNVKFVFQSIHFIKRRCSCLLCPISKYIMQSNMISKILRGWGHCAGTLHAAGGLVKPLKFPFHTGLCLAPVSSFSFSYSGFQESIQIECLSLHQISIGNVSVLIILF